jgi:hypothetical protein
MKNFLFLFALLVSGSGLKAQISTFDIDQKTLVYINYMPGDGPGYDYDYSDPSEFNFQYNDLLEVGAILPVWKKLNANIGIGSTLNFQEPELFNRSQYSVDYSPKMGKGFHLKTGISYSLQVGNFQIMPNIGVVWNKEVSYYWAWMPNDETYQLAENYSDLWGVFDAGVDVVYNNFLIGLTVTDLGDYYDNYLGLGIKLGYALTKKSKMNF